MGIVWPDLKDGRFSEESQLRRAGEFEIIDVHGTGYKLAGNSGINLYSYIYRNRLYLVLTVAASLLSKEEAEEFLKLLTGRISGSLHTA